MLNNCILNYLSLALAGNIKEDRINIASGRIISGIRMLEPERAGIRLGIPSKLELFLVVPHFFRQPLAVLLFKSLKAYHLLFSFRFLT